MLTVRVTRERLPAVELVDIVGADRGISPSEVGAWVEFRGLVRRPSFGRLVEAMTYDGHPALIATALEGVARALAPRFEVAWSARIDLRLGLLAIGEASVRIVTLSRHRATAYEVNRELLEGLKREAPIWKCEHYEDGTQRWLDGRSLREGFADDDVTHDRDVGATRPACSPTEGRH